MDPTITPTNAPQQTPVTTIVSAPEQKNASKNAYETVMLIFGALTIFSLVTNNGLLVKISVMVFLGVAITSIVGSLNKSRTDKQAAAPGTSLPATPIPFKKPMTTMRLLGIILLLLIGLPMVGYGLLFLLIFIAFSSGGGHAT